MYTGMPGKTGYIIDAFARNGKHLMATMNFPNLPEMVAVEQIQDDYLKEGMETLNRFGDNIIRYLAGDHRANIAHPKVQKRFAAHIEEPVRRYARNPGFSGIRYSLGGGGIGGGGGGSWQSLKRGYDDYTVNRFSQETGIKDPAAARYLPTANGTYFYAVILSGYDIEIKLDFSKSAPYKDLSTDGRLDLHFQNNQSKQTPGSDTACLMNAIELIRE